MALDTVDKVVAALAEAGMIPFSSRQFATVAGRLTNLQKAGTGGWGLMGTPAAIGSGGTLHVDSDNGFPAFSKPTGGELTYLGLPRRLFKLSARCWSMTACGPALECLALSPLRRQSPASHRSRARTPTAPAYRCSPRSIRRSGRPGRPSRPFYTNSANTSGRTTVAQNIGATALREVQRMIPMPLPRWGHWREVHSLRDLGGNDRHGWRLRPYAGQVDCRPAVHGGWLQILL